MTVKKVQELRGKRAGLVKEARGILERETTEKRSLAADEVEHYERIMEEVDGLRSQIEREERLAGIEGEFGKRSTEPEIDGGDDGTRSGPLATKEYRTAFWNAMRSGRNADPAELRDLFKAEDAKGGYLAPSEFETILLKELAKENIMRQLATVVQSSTDRKIPFVDTKPKFSYLAEKAAYGKTGATFGVENLGSHKSGGIILISDELLYDNVYNLETEMQGLYVEAQAELEEDKFISGTGTEQPTGFLVDAKLGVNTAVDGLTADDLIDLQYSVKRGYRNKGVYLMNDTTVGTVRKLKNSDGQYIWQPSLIEGEPDRISGRPLFTADAMPEVSTGNKSVAFGDFSKYRIMDRLGLSIQRLDELYAETGQVGFRCTTRNDGKLLDKEAIKFIKHA